MTAMSGLMTPTANFYLYSLKNSNPHLRDTIILQKGPAEFLKASLTTVPERLG